MNANWTLTGRRALVTGGTKGIGYAVADELLSLGAEVLIVARNANDVAAAVAGWTARGLPATGLAADLAAPIGQAAVFQHLQAQAQGLDILVNNVGTNIRKPFLEFTPADYERLFQVNLFSTLALCQLLYPLLKASGHGAIVNVGSVAGQIDVRTGPPYAMTKAALAQLSRNLAVEWAPDGIRVNTVSPWFTRTPLTEDVLARPGFLDQIQARTPLRRVAEPREMAAAVAFFCLPGASYITGQNLVVDGGMTAQGL
ncbi:SDR family oxidoreductase [uncultured Hymenobacter sp.]|uniref:SDR family oxidoreductase n=1 Tax=uncultured Hymenobacter sp. TaxID=170016 RepID=UPI0035CAFCB6